MILPVIDCLVETVSSLGTGKKANTSNVWRQPIHLLVWLLLKSDYSTFDYPYIDKIYILITSLIVEFKIKEGFKS